MGIQFGKEGICAVPLSHWLDYCCRNNTDSDVALPLIQRGSVWKPDQIIDLWDSLLRGMPVGSFMLNTMEKNTKARLAGQGHSIQLDRDGFGLLDGQQRTLAMLAGWPLRNGQPLMDRRVWVDFADKPGKEHLLRLRVTTENHPFGFSREDGKTKLPLSDRRKAIIAYLHLHGEKNTDNDKKSVELIEFRKALPYSAGNSLPVDLAELIKNYSADYSVFSTWLQSELENIKNYRVVKQGDDNAPSVDCIEVWSVLSDEQRGRVSERIRLVHGALGRLINKLYVPLILIDMDSVQTGDQPADEAPALAILFKRVGSNGTKLSSADYIFSVIKHRCPQTHDLVNDLCGRSDPYNIASLLTPTSLVTTAVRLAMTRCIADKNSGLRDSFEMDKMQFYRLLNGGVNVDGKFGNFLDLAFLPLIRSGEPLCMLMLFDALANLLKLRGEGDIGLPPYSLILLSRPLLQVLLFWVQILEADKNKLEASRLDVIRFIMFWHLCITDAKEASLKSYKWLKEQGQSASLFSIYCKLVECNLALPIHSPEPLEALIGKVIRIDLEDQDERPLKGWSRFIVNEDEPTIKLARDYYHRWWGKGSHNHPLLLWLQRNYVKSLPGSPVAGREEDTPYDYDHILPQSHWNYWTGQGQNVDRIALFMPKNDNQYWVIGNSIGNIRVWSSSDNRSDGATPPIKKLVNEDFFKNSAIPFQHKHWWDECSSEKQHRSWSKNRAIAFQRAVEERSWALYQQFYNELGFASWANYPKNETEMVNLLGDK